MYKFKHLLAPDAIFRYNGTKYQFKDWHFVTFDETLANHLLNMDFITLLEKPNDVDNVKSKHSTNKGK